MATPHETHQVSVRFFAAAAAAAGSGTRDLQLTDGATLTDLQTELSGDNPELARVLAVSSYLVNGTASPSPTEPLPAGASVDVLPPFAGG